MKRMSSKNLPERCVSAYQNGARNAELRLNQVMVVWFYRCCEVNRQRLDGSRIQNKTAVRVLPQEYKYSSDSRNDRITFVGAQRPCFLVEQSLRNNYELMGGTSETFENPKGLLLENLAIFTGQIRPQPFVDDKLSH